MYLFLKKKNPKTYKQILSAAQSNNKEIFVYKKEGNNPCREK